MGKCKLTICAIMLFGLTACGDNPPQPRYPNERPVADLQVPLSVNVFEEVVLDASGSYDPDGRITEYQFNLGDTEQTIITGNATLSHTYNERGDFTVLLTVVDDRGSKDSTATLIAVQ